MSKSKIPELHPQIKDIIYNRLSHPPYTGYDEERLNEIREDILKRIGHYKEIKSLIIQYKEEHESLVKWVEENNINLDLDENGK